MSPIARVFISYRREDTGAFARLIARDVEQRFAGVRVFLDVRDLEGGADYRAVIRQHLETCDVVLVLIGRRWLTGGRFGGVGDERDEVAFELRLALSAAAARDLPVVPVLVDGAAPLSQDELPAPLATLARLNAQQIAHDRYDADIQRLLSVLERRASLASRAPARNLADTDTDTDTATEGPHPPAPTLCVGRDELLADLVAAMLATLPTPIPVLGGPGMGKTTACLAAFHEPSVAARYGDRRWFVRCDAADGPQGIVEAIAGSTGATDGVGTAWRRAIAVLDAGPALLVLDNLESPWEADQTGVEGLLAAITAMPRLVLVVTMRGTVRPYGIQWRDTEPVTALTETAARAMFLAIAGRKFEDDACLKGLLKSLDGVPLALALLAHNAQGEPHLGQLTERWRVERATLLQRAGGVGRDLSVGASIELSLRSPRLTDGGRRLLSLLAQLPDGMAHQDLPVILPHIGFGGATNLRQLGLVFDEGDRLRTLSPVRAHLVSVNPPTPSDRAGAADFYARLAATSGSRVGGVDGAAELRRIAGDANNIAEVLRWARLDDADLMTDAVVGLLEYHRFAGAPVPSLLSDVAAQIDASGTPGQRARVAALQGRVNLARSAYDSASQDFGRGLRLFGAAGDMYGEADCRRGLAHIARDRGAYDEALMLYERSAQSSRDAGDVLGEAHCQIGLGDVALARWDLQSADAYYRGVLAICRSASDRLGKAHVSHGLAYVALRRSDANGARQLFERAGEMYEAAGALIGRAHCTLGSGHLALLAPDLPGARDRYENAFVRYQQIGHVLGEAHCLYSLGLVAEHSGESDLAESRFEQALAKFDDMKVSAGRAIATHALGHLAYRRGERSRGHQHFAEALELFRRLGDVRSERQVRDDMAGAALDQPRHGAPTHERLPEPHATGMAGGRRTGATGWRNYDLVP